MDKYLKILNRIIKTQAIKNEIEKKTKQISKYFYSIGYYDRYDVYGKCPEEYKASEKIIYNSYIKTGILIKNPESTYSNFKYKTKKIKVN